MLFIKFEFAIGTLQLCFLYINAALLSSAAGHQFVADCKVSEWGEYKPCDSKCGRGRKTRYRVVVQERDEGGAHCPHLDEFVTCENAPCPSGKWQKASVHTSTLLHSACIKDYP